MKKKSIIIMLSAVCLVGIVVAVFIITKTNSKESETQWGDLTDAQKENVMYIFPEAETMTGGQLDIWKDNEAGFKEVSYLSEKEECQDTDFIYSEDVKTESASVSVSRHDIIQKAKEYATVSYDGVIVGKDEGNKLWSISFYQYADSENCALGYNVKQRVYLNYDGSLRNATKEIDINY